MLGRYNDPGLQLDESIGAVIVEPMLGSGGCIPATAEFLALPRAEATHVGAVLVFDEVMTSRMSAGGQQARRGITPDMTTLGKYIGGGMSFGAFGGRADLMERYDPRRADAIPHAGTFNNNVLTMAAGVAGLSRIFTAEAADALYARGEALRAQLNALSPGLPVQWTGLGSLMTVHFRHEPIASPGDLRPDAGLRELFFLDMLERGFYLARRGMLAMSLEIDAAEAEGFVAAVAEFIQARGSLLRAA